MGNLTATDACYAMVKNRLEYNHQEAAKSRRSTLDLVEVVWSLSYKAQCVRVESESFRCRWATPWTVPLVASATGPPVIWLRFLISKCLQLGIRVLPSL